jgi:hypothetical protein
MFAREIQLIVFAKIYTRKERHYQILATYVVEDGGFVIVSGLNLPKEVNNMVGLAKVVLDIVILCGDAEFDELVFECATLLKEAIHLTSYLHNLTCYHPRQ